MADFHHRDGAYLLLLALAAGHALTVHDDRVVIADPTNPNGPRLPVGPTDLDDLEAAGLLTTTGPGTDDGPAVTDKGRYWLKRWVAAHFKVRGFRVSEVRMTPVGGPT